MSAPDRLLRRSEVENLTGLATSTIYALMSREQFPRPVRVSKAAVRWKQSTIAAWIEQQPAVA